MLSVLGKHKPFFYGLVQRDWNNDVPLVVGSVTTNFDYDSWYLGTWDQRIDRRSAALWHGVRFYEGGKTLSNSFEPGPATLIAQERDHIEAAALAPSSIISSRMRKRAG